MVEIDKILSERSDERILKAIKAVSDEEFHRLVEKVLGYLELRTTKSRPKGSFYIADCVHKPDGKQYVAFVSRRDDPVTVSDIQSLISYIGRVSASNGLIITASSIVPNGVDLAESNNIGLADGSKFAALLRRFDLDKEVARAADVREARARVVSVPTGMDRHVEDEMTAGYAALADRDYMDALDHFDRAILIKEDYDVPWRLKGNVLDEMGYHEQALECYKHALELYPESDEAWFSLGNSLFALGRYEEEIMCYDRALQYNPQMLKALINKGSTLHRLGRYEDALAAYDKALKINYRLEKVHNNRGATLHSLGRHKDALAAYNAAIELKHDYVEAWMNKGNLLYEMGRTEESLEAFTQMTQVRPEMAKGWYLRGLAARRLGNVTVAKASFEQALKLDPDFADARKALEQETEKLAEKFSEVPRILKDIFSSEAATARVSVRGEAIAAEKVVAVEEKVEELAEEIYGDRAELLFLLGRYDEAFDFLGRSLQLEGENARLVSAAGNVLYALERMEAAIKTYEHALAIDQDYVPALLNLHAVLTEAGERERAARVVDRLRKSVPGWQAKTAAALDAWWAEDHAKALEDIDSAVALEDLSGLLNFKGLMKIHAGDTKGAIAAFERALAMPMDPSEGHNNRGVALFTDGDWEKASLEFDKAIKLQRDSHVAWNNRGCVLYKVERLREAVACFDESLVVLPTSAAMTNKGFILLSMDQLQEAEKALRESVRIAETPEAYNNLGIVLTRQGKKEEALTAFKDALRLAPTFKDAAANARGDESPGSQPQAQASPKGPEPPQTVVVGEKESTEHELPKYTQEMLREKTKSELMAISESLGAGSRGTKEELIARVLKAKETKPKK